MAWQSMGMRITRLGQVHDIHPTLQRGKPGPPQSFLAPGTHREAHGESFLGSGVHYLALCIVSLVAGFSIFYRRVFFPPNGHEKR